MADPIQELLDLEREIRLSHQEIFRQTAENYRSRIRFLRGKLVKLRKLLRLRVSKREKTSFGKFPA